MVASRGPQVLGDGQQVASSLVQVTHRLDHLFDVLTHTQDEVRLGHQPGCAGLREHVQRSLVPESRPDPLHEARNRLKVVGQDLGAGIEDRTQQVRFAVEVGDEHLDSATRHPLVYLPDRLGVQPRALVGEVITGHARDGCVAQAHLGDGVGDLDRFVTIKRLGTAGIDLAEVAPACALVAADEECGLAVLPALVDVGAPRLLAHCVQSAVGDPLPQLVIGRTHDSPGLDPCGLSLNRDFGVAHLEAQEFATVGGGSCHGSSLRSGPGGDQAVADEAGPSQHHHRDDDPDVGGDPGLDHEFPYSPGHGPVRGIGTTERPRR